ncbi:MAG: preprotein translocase subunit SecE [Alicyclobacillus sp.]|nr:preprotein translocase subunit SecE [Alicyclobacillus sp.]
MAKPKPSDKVAQPARKTGLIQFLRESVRELKRVRWPNRREVTTYTAAALIVCFAMALLVWGFDLGVSKVLSLIHVV